MKKIKRKYKVKRLAAAILFLGIIVGCSCFYMSYVSENKQEDKYLASETTKVSFYNEKLESIIDVVRGTKVTIYPNQKLEEKYVKSKYSDKIYYINQDNLVDDINMTVLEDKVYVRTSYNLLENESEGKLLSLVKKGDELTITGFDKLLDDGNVNMYKVKTASNEEGYFYQKYVVNNIETSKLPYDNNGSYKVHEKRKDIYGGGNAASLDYYPVDKPSFANNVMPESVYALYLNGTKSVISKVNSYIDYAKKTKINAFVVDIKDSGVSAYASKVMQEYSPTSYKSAQNSLDNYKEAIKKIKDAGFYVIGRITTFKDEYYIKDNKDKSISDNNNQPLYHQNSYWPTAFNRDVWEYNVLLAKEAVTEMGFNEIQFDYVRFPDGLKTREAAKTVEYKNTNNETKAEAIQRFLMYATNEIHKLNAYVSCDVFGESSWGYVTSYGQYWPAMSNIVDAISAMPYTDHFGNTYGGNTSPWLYPYETMSTWGKTAASMQKETTSPAIVRTWITAYNTPYWAPTATYNGDALTKQINALYDQGLTGGYMTWNSLSSLEKYKMQESAYTKEYK